MLGSITEYANDVMIVVDAGGKILEANQKFWPAYGYRPDDLPSLSIADLRSPNTLATLDADLRRADQYGALTFETEHRRQDGSIFPVEVSTRVINNDADLVKLSIIRDITDRKNAERQIAKLSKLHGAVTAAHQALLQSTSADEVFVRICNTATNYGLKLAWVGLMTNNTVIPVRWSGEGSDYLSGLQITIDPTELTSWGPTGRAVRSGKHVICNDFLNDPTTTPWHTRGALYGWRASAAFPLFRGGNATGALTIYSDESGYFGESEVALFDELAESISCTLDRLDVEARGNELEQRLRKSLDQLTDAHLELERFSEIYSHDLQEPVREVVISTQRLKRMVGESLDQEAAAMLDEIIAAAMRIRQLNEDLLIFSRSRHTEAAQGLADAEQALRYACDELQAAFDQAGADIRIRPLPKVLCSLAEMRQIFLNLLSNSLKFASPDRRLMIEIDARPEENGWHFMLRDNGIGIEPQYHNKVFGIFIRLHAASSYPGTGVGLAVTKRIIERRGGRIWIDSHLDVGTTVHFWLRGVNATAEAS